jgi:hypothetical protein
MTDMKPAAREGLPQGGRFDVGRVLRRACTTIIANPFGAIGIALLFGSLPNLPIRYVADNLPYYAQHLTQVLALVGAGVVVGGAVQGTLQGAFVRLTLAHEARRSARFGEEVMAIAGALPMLVILGLVMTVATTLGLALLVIPGMLLSVIWIVAPSALVDERLGIVAALRRSAMLTKGARWPIFGLLTGFGVANYALGQIGQHLVLNHYGADIVADVLKDGIPAGYLAVHIIAGTFIFACSAALNTSIYVELRTWKLGSPTDTLAEIFA